jgi:MFS family permease
MADRAAMPPRSRYVLFVAIAFTVIASLPLFLAAAQSTVLQSDLGYGSSGFGLAVGISFAAAVVFSPPTGVLIGRAGPVLGFRLTCLVAGGSMLWLGLVADSWLGLIVGFILCGVGNALAQVTASIGLAAGVDRRFQGRAFGIRQAAVPVTSLAAGVAASVLGPWAGWRAMYVAVGVATLILVLWRPKLDFDHFRQDRAAKSRGRWRRYLPLAALGVLVGAVGTFFSTFTVDTAVAFDYSEGTGSLLLALGSAVAVAVRIGIGQLVDRRRSNGLVEIASLSLITIACVGVMALFEGTLVFAAALIAGVGFGWGTHGLIPNIGARVSTAADTGAVMGIATASVYTGNILGPFITGFMIETSFELAWTFVVVLCIIAATVALRMERRIVSRDSN